jgi:hypothetical protein
MLLPDKHITIAESLFGLAYFLLGGLTDPQTLESIWDTYRNAVENRDYPADHSLQNVIFALDFLFTLGIVKFDGRGRIVRCV